MCGIAGFLTLGGHDTKEAHAIGEAMHRSMIHRGPDDCGVWQDPDTALVLAHRRLSIIDLSPEGHQPMESHSKRYVITYNGEIYNYQDLRQELINTGYPFKGRSDTEVLLAAFDVWGVSQTLQKINGMFAFVLWDRSEQQIHCVRDRFGKKPLYIGWSGNTLLFASELKACKAHPNFVPAIDPAVTALYMQYAFVPAPYCIYKNMSQLLAGHILTLSLKDLQAGQDLAEMMKPYWHAARIAEDSRNALSPSSEEFLIQEFEDTLMRSVKSRMVSDVPLGAFLSGGIDSSTVVALMQKYSTNPVQTFSIGFEEQDYNEALYAKKIAQHLGTDHHEMICTAQEAMDVIPKLPEMFDEPFADPSQIPTYLVSNFARKHVTVALSGDGGDEMLGGYRRHMAAQRLHNYTRFIPSFLRKAMGGFITAVPEHVWGMLNPFSAEFGHNMHRLGQAMPLRNKDDLYKVLVSHWDSEKNINTQSYAKKTLLFQQESWNVSHLSAAEDMMLRDTLHYLPGSVLTKVDRASMAVSLEARAPLLDRRIYEFCWKLPHAMKMRGKTGKWLLRQVLARHVPVSLFERPKQGFSVPVGEWIKGPLRDWAEALLDTKLIRDEGYFDADLVRKTWEEHLAGHRNHTMRLWSLLMFQAWREKEFQSTSFEENKRIVA